MKFKYFDITNKTLEDIKIQYRKLSRKYHPDLGGDTSIFQEINMEYRHALELLKRKAFQQNDINLFKLINEQIYNIDEYICKLNVPEPLKPAISYLVERGINELGKIITSKLNKDAAK